MEIHDICARKELWLHTVAASDLCIRLKVCFSKTLHCTAALEDFWVGQLTQIPIALAQKSRGEKRKYSDNYQHCGQHTKLISCASFDIGGIKRTVNTTELAVAKEPTHPSPSPPSTHPPGGGSA